MHTALGALGTGTLEGAITTGTVAASAPKINDFQNSVAQALTHTGMSEKAAEAVASGVTSLTLAGAGVASGLNTGSTATAVNVDANNRQLHVDEAKVLKKLTEGKTEVEQTRLRAAACALVHCSEGVPESDVNYKTLKAFEALGKTYIKEQNALKATGLFTYSNWDKANDIRTNHDEAVTRVGGAGKVITGSVTAIGGSAAGAGLCTTGLGCAVGAPLAGVSVVGGVSTAIEGKNQVFGDYTSQEGKKVIDSYNPNRKQELSQLSQDALNGAIAVAEAVLLGKVGGKLSQGAKSEAKTSEQVMNDGTKSGTKTNSEITVNPITGLKEVNPSTTPLNSHDKLNKLDQGKLKPAEAATGAQLESVLGPMKKYELSGGQLNKNPDWEIVSGPNKGKTVDAMYTTDNLSQKEIDGLNKFYEKNMTMGSGKQNIQEHLNKADFVPIDFRVLTPNNQKIFLNYLQSLPKSQRDKIIIVR
nr:hypothetical protein [Acinetobacter sp.]